MTPLLTLFLCKRLSNLGYIVQSYMRNPWKNNQTNTITSSWQTVMWPCLDKHKGQVLKFCWINHVNLIKNLSQLLYTLAKSLVQHHQLTPAADCVGCEGLQRSAVMIRLKKMSFLPPSLPGHGALQGTAVTFAMTSLKCSEHRLSSMANLDVQRERECFTETFWIMVSIPPSSEQDTIIYSCCIWSTYKLTFLSLILMEPYFQQLHFFFFRFKFKLHYCYQHWPQ